MTNQKDRAIRFANNVRNLNRFTISDVVTKNLYGYTAFVIDPRSLRAYYERHETIKEWRDFDTFRAVIEERFSASN